VGCNTTITAHLKKILSTEDNNYDSAPSLAGVARRFLSFHRRYSFLFKAHTKSFSKQACCYLKGLFQADKKNMERIEERVPDTRYENLQYFLSEARWEHQAVNDQIAQDVDAHLGGHEDTGLYIDETGIPKKGKSSVGVGRQYCGQLGKTENCQVAVFSVLGRDKYASPIDYRLYLPKSWTDDPERCRKAKVPVEQMAFRTKPELALELVASARANGVRFNWVGCDALYGQNQWFVRQLERSGETFVADVHCDQRIYLEDPKPTVPARTAKRGRVPRKLKAGSAAVRVDKWVKKQATDIWQRIDVRDSSKGVLQVDAFCRRVWLWDGAEATARLWWLVVRREVNSPNKIKYSLSNAPDDVSLQRLVYMQAQRYWVERSFQDGKTQCGLGEYQVRGWYAWHHHMSLVMMAQLFMLEERLLHQETCRLLSTADITILLKNFLPRRDITEEEVLRQLEVRHRKRQADIDAARRKQDKIPNNGELII
jgi:SRSO17 transposase